MRIQFDISEDRLKDIKSLMKKSHMTTNKDFFNSALALLEWAILEKEVGRSIASVDKEEKQFNEIIMPALSNVPKK